MLHYIRLNHLRQEPSRLLDPASPKPWGRLWVSAMNSTPKFEKTHSKSTNPRTNLHRVYMIVRENENENLVRPLCFY
eukprot:20216_4